jgi:hypothetical protein
MTWQSVRSKFPFCNKHSKMKFICRWFSSIIKMYVLFNSIRKILLIHQLWFLAEIGKFYKSFSIKSLFEYKKNVYPVHKPAAVDYNMFNFGEFSFGHTIYIACNSELYLLFCSEVLYHTYARHCRSANREFWVFGTRGVHKSVPVTEGESSFFLTTLQCKQLLICNAQNYVFEYLSKSHHTIDAQNTWYSWGKIVFYGAVPTLKVSQGISRQFILLSPDESNFGQANRQHL